VFVTDTLGRYVTRVPVGPEVEIGPGHHHVARFDLACVRDQVYRRPHPKELMPRNHV
jgi:hypothetical protein